MSQAEQDLDDGETRHESREPQAHEHEHPHERERCSGRNTRTPVQRETTRKIDNQTSRAEKVCPNNACMNDVHMTSPHDSSRLRSRPLTRHNHKGLALWWLITLDESSPQGVPARTSTAHWGRCDGRPWVAQTTPQRAKWHAMTHHSNKTTDRSSDIHGSGAVTTTPGSTRQDAEGVSRASDVQPAGTEDCQGTAGADREDDAIDPASDGSECNDRAVEHSCNREHNSAHVRRLTRTWTPSCLPWWTTSQSWTTVALTIWRLTENDAGLRSQSKKLTIPSGTEFRRQPQILHRIRVTWWKVWVRNARMKKRRKWSRRSLTTHSRADRRYDSPAAWVKAIPREWAVSTTPQMTCFRGAKVCTKWLQGKSDDHRIQSDYKCTIGLQNSRGKKSVLGVASAWWNRARHQWQRDQQDPEHLQHSAHEHWHVSAQFSCLLVRFLSSCFTHCIAWLKGVAHVISSTHEVCGSPSTLSPPFPSTSSSFHSSLTSCTSSCTSSTTLRAVATLRTSPERRWTLLTTPTSSQVMSPTPTTSRRLSSSPTWVNSVWMQDFWVLLRMDSISWRKTLEISHNFMQWPVVNTLSQEKTKHHNRKDGSKETPKLGPYWKLQPVICTVNMELRDNTHSWVRTSHWSNKFVMNLNNNETEIPEDQLEECALKLSENDFACRSKAKAKPQRRELAGSSPRIVLIERRNWLDIEPGKYSFSEYEVSKKETFLLRHSQQMHREEDGAFHFWRIKENLQNQFPQSIHWSDDRWKACLAGGGGVKRKFQYCTDDSGTIVHFRALQGHSGRNLIDPSLQDNVVFPSNFFQYLYHVGCAFKLRSIINSGLLSGGQS